MAALQPVERTQLRGLNAHISYEKVPNGKRIKFTFKLGTRPKWTSRFHFFIPLKPEQFTAIEEYRERLSEENAPAYASITLNQPEKTLTWRLFHPHGLDRNVEVFKAPIRKGIATAVHLAITKFLADRYALHRVIHDNRIPLERIEHLRQMGIDHYKRYKVEDYYEIIRSYARSKGLLLEE